MERLKLGLVAWLACVLVSGCLGTSWEKVHGSNNVDELRRFVRDNPRDPMVDEARIRIAELEYLAALAADTRYAYNSFLERHAETSFALEIRRKLEELDFSEARADMTVGSLSAFLRRHPSGRYSDQAREQRSGLLCERWRSGRDPRALASFIDKHPDIPCRVDLDERLKRLRLQQALAEGRARELIDFVESYPDDRLAAEATRLLLGRLVEALIRAARFERARRVVNLRADADQADGLLSRIQRAEAAWRLASFDLRQYPQQAGQLAERHRRLGRRLEPLFRATSRLRRPLAESRSLRALPGDPRDRWLQADRLGRIADESAADALLDLLGDTFLEVRRRAIEALGRALDRLGPVRGQVWLGEQRSRLKKKARSGILLLKLAALNIIAGESIDSSIQLQRLTQEGERPNLFALYLSFGLSDAASRPRETASLARRFSAAAQAFAHQRTAAWSNDGDVGLGGTSNAWLTLRQMYGLIVLWRDVLEPFSPIAGEPARLRDHRSVLGPWSKKAEQSLQDLQRWFANEESRWMRSHREYRPCGTPLADRAAGDADPAAQIELDAADLALLALAGMRTAVPTLRWAACCHPRDSTRSAAASLLVGARLFLPAIPFPFALVP